MNHPQWNEEVQHLIDTRLFIQSLLGEKIQHEKNLSSQQTDINKDMWEETRGFNDLEGITEFMQHIDQLKQNMALTRFNRTEIERLDRLFLSPYFARIDFGMQGEPIAPCYIGITTLMDDNTAKVLIFDWRAPLSSLYYDSEPGKVQYLSPSGDIYGEMTLKRQFRLESGKLVLMFDAALAIYDDILQEILASATGGRMKQIVNTIQKEQNKAIRNEDTKVLAIQGSAGSGKTSIALHRAAYLLYHHRNKLNSENLVILSPNSLMGSYIANVLPELGEDEIIGIPFTRLAEDYLELDRFHIEKISELMEDTLAHPSDVRTAGIRVKTSQVFLHELQQFTRALAEKFPFEDICYHSNVLVSKNELNQLYSVDFASMGIGNRLERIRLRIAENLRQVERVLLKQRKIDDAEDVDSEDNKETNIRGRASIRQELMHLREQVEASIQLDPVLLYKRFLGESKPSESFIDICNEALQALSDNKITYVVKANSSNTHNIVTNSTITDIWQETMDNIDAGLLVYEDLVPVFLIALEAKLCKPDTKVRHVMIDEAQDYNLLQYEVLKLLFPMAGMTLLGDNNQNIQTDFSVGNLKTAAKSLSENDHLLLQLTRSYRSTRQITAFSDYYQITPVKTAHFERDGRKPALTLCKGKAMIPAAIGKLLENMTNTGNKSITLITRTYEESRKLYETLKANSDLQKYMVDYPLHLVNETYMDNLEGIIIIPSYLAKGLEFEHVVVIFNDKETYSLDKERGLFYTVCTRALHDLTFLSADGMPDCLQRVKDIGVLEIFS